MKLKKAVSVLFAFLPILFFACKKDSADNNNNVNNNNPTQPATTDSNYLSKIYIIDSTGAVEDTSEKLNFYYDAAKRVININDSFINSGVAVPFVTTTYYYNGTDTLPYKSFRTSADNNNYDTTTRFYYYDAAGRRIKDSSISSTNNGSAYNIHNTISTYQFVTGKIYGYSRDTAIYPVLAFPAFITIDTATLDANNNITSNIKHRGTGSTINSVITNTNLPNIYQRINIRGNFDVFPRGYATYNNFATSNNPSYMLETWSGFSTNVFESNNTYIFNNNGFVTEVVATYTSYPGSYFKSVLVYQSL